MIKTLSKTEIRQIEDVVLALGGILAETDERRVVGVLRQLQGDALVGGQPEQLSTFFGKVAELSGEDRDKVIVQFMRNLSTMARDGYAEVPDE